MHIRPIAIYLPQFHPIPENDAWWGKGFTEWTNVVKAMPRFRAHYQPHLPADLGFYDLRLPEVLQAQAELARQYGMHGFCYYHYWFNGKRLLNRPLDNMLNSKDPDFPFMLCWANENWTRAWDGLDKQVLIGQHYTVEDHINHIQFLCRHFFSDKRYIRVDNKPVLLIYRTELIPDVEKMATIWRTEAQRFGLPDLYLISVESLSSTCNPAGIGLDAAMEFQPSWKNLPAMKTPTVLQRIARKLAISREAQIMLTNRIYEYDELVAHALRQHEGTYKQYKCVTPMWDNSPRRNENATIFVNSTPEKYGYWLSETIRRFRPFSGEENFVFINAWNEWAEGNHLEPCQKWGKAYLEETRKGIHS